VGALLPLLIVGLTVLLVGRPRFSELNLVRGTLLTLLIALPWHVLAAWQAPDLFRFYLVDNQLLRFLNLRAFLEDDVPITTPAFLAVSFLLAFPWSVFLLGRAGTTTARQGAWRPLVWIWIAVVVGFFTLSGSKLEYYALPAFPAVALRAGAALSSRRDTGVWLAIGLVGCSLVGAAALWIGARLTAPQALDGLAELNVYYRILRDQGRPLPFPSAEPFGLLLQALGLTLLVGWGVAALAWRLGWPRASIAAVLGIGLVVAVLIVRLLDVIEPHHSARDVANAIRKEARGGEPVVHEGALEYSAALPLYTGRRILVVNGRRGDLEIASRRPEAREVFLDPDDLRRLWLGDGRVFLVTREPAGAGVVAALPVGRVRDLGSYGSRRLYSNR
jgi:4-amino-4-deoxy-L-arabinose transferase-like glycosyltransferase